MDKLKKILRAIWIQKINSFLIILLLPLYKNKPLKNIIVIESHTNFDCNGGALYKYLVDKGFNKKYKIVWRIREGAKFSGLPSNVYTVSEDRPSIKRVLAFLNAKYFFSDNTMPKKPRQEQISVYCTHGGCTIKNVKGLLVVRDDVDYVLSSSSGYDPVMCENFSIPYPNEKMLHFGFPSNDILFDENIEELRKITDNKFSKIILWLPTFRKNENGREDGRIESTYGIPLLENELQFEVINDILKEYNALLIIKLHPAHDDRGSMPFPQLSNIIIIDPKESGNKGIDVYKLMSISDALISDYSSSSYSYILRDKPIGFVLSDLDSYKPGLAVEDLDKFLVGTRIYSDNDLKGFVTEVCNGKDTYSRERKNLLNWLYEYRDGNSCKRIVDYFKL